MKAIRTFTLTLVALGAAGCAHETLLSELGTTRRSQAPAAAESWRAPGPNPLAAPDGAACTWADQCRSGYCSQGVCEHTDSEPAPLVVAPPDPSPPVVLR